MGGFTTSGQFPQCQISCHCLTGNYDDILVLSVWFYMSNPSHVTPARMSHRKYLKIMFDPRSHTLQPNIYTIFFPVPSSRMLPFPKCSYPRFPQCAGIFLSLWFSCHSVMLFCNTLSHFFGMFWIMELQCLGS